MRAWLSGLALFLLAAYTPARAFASLPSVSEPRPRDFDLPQLTSALEEIERRESERAACGAFCVEPLKLGLRASLGPGTPFLDTQDAWGVFKNPAELDASANRHAFTGYVFEKEIGLYFAKARFYDPTVGRFTSQDSFLGSIDDPPSLPHPRRARGLFGILKGCAAPQPAPRPRSRTAPFTDSSQ